MHDEDVRAKAWDLPERQQFSYAASLNYDPSGNNFYDPKLHRVVLFDHFKNTFSDLICAWIGWRGVHARARLCVLGRRWRVIGPTIHTNPTKPTDIKPTLRDDGRRKGRIWVQLSLLVGDGKDKTFKLEEWQEVRF